MDEFWVMLDEFLVMLKNYLLWENAMGSEMMCLKIRGDSPKLDDRP